MEMSELLKLIENKDKEILNIQEKKKDSNIDVKEELINILNIIINEKIELSKIYDKYYKISNKANQIELKDNSKPSQDKIEDSY